MLNTSLQDAVLRFFPNVAAFSKDKRCRNFTRFTYSKENLMWQFFRE